MADNDNNTRTSLRDKIANSKFGKGVSAIKEALPDKFVKGAAAAPLALFGAALAAAVKVTKKFSNSMDKAAAVGKNIEALNGLMGGTVKELTEVQANVNSLTAQFGRLGNSIKVFFGKIADFLTSDAFDKLVADANALALQSTAKASLISSGQSNVYAEKISEHITDLADRYIMKKYGVSLTDARGSDAYATTVKGITDAIVRGGAFELFNTDLWKAFAYQEGKYTPGLDYTSTTEAQARDELFERLMSIYTTGDADAVAHFQHQLTKTNKLLEMIGNNLYSFDEVENIAAYTDKEYKEIASLNEKSGQQMSKISKEVLDLGNEFGLTVPEMRRIEEFIQRNGVSVQDVKYLLENGIYFENDDILNLLNNMYDKGFDVNGIVNLTGLKDINLNSTEGIDKLTEAINNMPRSIVLELNSGKLSEEGAKILESTGVMSKEEITDLTTQNAIIEQLQNALDTYGYKPEFSNKIRDLMTQFPEQQDFIIDILKKAIDDLMEQGVSSDDLLYFVQTGLNVALNQAGRATSYRDKQRYLEYYNEHKWTPFITDEEIYDWFDDYRPDSRISGGGGHYATGGIGTDRIDNVTLFENGPEAIIPLTSNLGVDYMARVMEQVNASNGSSDSLTVNFNGPVFTEDQRQLHYWAEKLGETYDTIKKRRGVV